MKTSITERISLLRRFMQENGIGAYITFSTDPHAGEYVPAHWESRKWITGFTGSAGTAVITLNDGGLWTDSRYFLQAEEQLSGSGLKLFKERLPETPSICEWLGANLPKGSKIGFDGYTTSISIVDDMRAQLSRYEIEAVMTEDPYKYIWSDRPSIADDKPFILEERFTGQSTKSKIEKIRKEASIGKNDTIIISSLDEIAWTLNMRGKDIHCNPLFISYLMIFNESAIIYINSNKLSTPVIEYLHSHNISIKEYEDIESDLKSFAGYNISVSPSINYALFDAASYKNNIKIAESPVTKLKAIKNATEIAGFREAMKRDGIAMVRFLIWLKQSVLEEDITELSLDKKLYEYRSEMKHFRGISFDTIAGYQEHGAIVHYEATEESALHLKSEGLLLLDSGAQYLDGTTDITRTIPLGTTSEKQKKDYTLVLKGFIQLAMAEFPDGTCGTQLDSLARMAMWRCGINYGHGTGHGVGHFLNVHEGPHQIRMNHIPAILKPGMTITNEPGIYRSGEYGIRTENTMLIVPSQETEFGKFYKFEQLTLCPIDKEPIITEMLSDEEISWLNGYHQKVYDTLASGLNQQERLWLKDMTAPIYKK
ncbi:aminopeptidase P family protein [Bacteroides caecigallinarum]|uniref:aminopeptidase P family protein n=1 Tax=Bacteroides caecigallinarum TaxID=1411144 RepID=UPI001F3A919D|nr:aminopeptidase P family protein [Bacteroides caecigallinarum]MCF2593802.1 aminopeptidase P family protein [Bacteroides caecigallinarum]